LPRFARNRLSNFMLLVRNDEITTLSSIARDDVVKLPQMGYNEADVVRLARLKGKKCR